MLGAPAATPGRILVYGDFYWDRLAGSYRRAFEELGWEVVPFDCLTEYARLPRWLRSRVGSRLTRRSLWMRRHGARDLNAALLRCARDVTPTCTFILNGEMVMPETVEALQTIGPVFMFHADNPLPGYANNRPETMPVACRCDTYFIWSRTVATCLRAAGVRRVEYLPFAWDPVVFPYVGLADRPCYDVVFVGGWDRQREETLNEVASRFRLDVWGPPYWVTRTYSKSPVRRSWRGEIHGAKGASVIARAGVTLNLLRRQNLPDGTNMRTFEVPGIGGLLLATRSPGAEDLFPSEHAALYFGSTAELCDTVARIRKSPRDGRAMAAEAHSLVHARHQYRHRAERVLEVLAEVR